MKLATFAPHLAGRMLPPMISALLPEPPRFPGDPRAEEPAPTHACYWMHATGCPGGLFRARRFEPGWREVVRPAPAQFRLFAEMAA